MGKSDDVLGGNMKNGKLHSISFWIKLLLILITVPIAITLICINVNMRAKLRMQTAEINEDMLSLYMEQIDTQLNDMDVYLMNFMEKNEHIVDIQTSRDPNARQLEKFELFTDLKQASIDNHFMNGFFAYTADDVNGEFFTGVGSEKEGISNRIANTDIIKNRLLQEIEKETLDTSRWFCWQLDDRYYLLRIVYNHNTYLGCWVSLDDLVKPFEKIDLGQNGFSAILSKEGKILTNDSMKLKYLDVQETEEEYKIVSTSKKYIQIQVPFQTTNLYLAALIPDENIQESYRSIGRVLLFVSLLILVLIPLSAILVHYFIQRPLKSLIETMWRIKKGNLNAKADEKSDLEEFCTLNVIFNEMIEEVNHLKIDIYEQKLKEKETYLQYLQLQIHPHFFLNCMSLMHNLAELKEYQQIKKLSKSLVGYFRHMFRKTTKLIPLEEELDLVKNYMTIQNIRFPKGITCTSDVDENVADMMVPVLSIQTFVENAVKYAVDLTKETRIEVKAEKCGMIAKVTIQDNGAGFPVDMLMELNSEQNLFSRDETRRIGIRNVKERMKLIFGENAYIHFYNNQGGRVEYLIPIVKEGENDVSGVTG